MADRGREWNEFAIDVLMVAGTRQAFTLFSPDELRSTTLIRIIMDLYFCPDSVSSNGQGITVLDFGIGIATAQAIAVAAGAGVPDPAVANQRPPRGWLVRGRLFAAQEGSSGVQEVWKVTERHFDLRAARKIDNALVFMALTATTVGGTAFGTNLLGWYRGLSLT